MRPADSTAGAPAPRLVLGWAVGYAAASLVLSAPFLRVDALDAFPAWGDPRLIAWTLAWHARWPLVGGGPLAAPFFVPEPQALAYSEPMIGLGVLTAPLTAVAGPIVAFNLLRLLIPVVNGLSAACLAWHYLRDARAAFACGFALAFAYGQIGSAYLGMVHLQLVGGIAVTAWCLDRWWHAARPRDLAAATATAVLQTLVSWYAGVLAIIAIVVQLAWLAATAPAGARGSLRRLAALAVAGAAAAALLWPAARPFTGMPAPERGELGRFSLEGRNFIEPPTETLAGAVLTGTTRHDGSWDYRRSYFVGLGIGVAALGGLGAAVRHRAARRLLWGVPLAALGTALALGPGEGWRLFDLVSAIPGVAAFRVPGRMAVLVTIGAALLAAAGIAAVPPQLRSGATALLAALIAAEGLLVHIKTQPSPPLSRPGIFSALRADAPDAALVLPMLGRTPRWPDEADYLLFALPSWTPIANGYGRRTPPVYEVLLDAVAGFERRGAPLADTLRYYGVTHVVVLARYAADGGARFHAAASASRDFERRADDDGDVLYRVRPAPPASAFRTPARAAPRS